MTPGSVLHIPDTGPAHDKKRGHYFVVLTAPQPPADGCLIVPICSAHEKCDRTCLLQPNDHTSINRESFISYSQMKVYSSKHLTQKITSGVIETQRVVSPDVFVRIRKGVTTSPLAAPVYKSFLAKAL